MLGRDGRAGGGKESGDSLVHVGEKIIFSIALDDFRDGLSGVKRHGCSTCRSGCSIRRWNRVILTATHF